MNAPQMIRKTFRPLVRSKLSALIRKSSVVINMTQFSGEIMRYYRANWRYRIDEDQPFGMGLPRLAIVKCLTAVKFCRRHRAASAVLPSSGESHGTGRRRL